MQVAAELPWTSRATPFAELDGFNGALAALETRNHLELLVARGELRRVGASEPGDELAYEPA